MLAQAAPDTELATVTTLLEQLDAAEAGRMISSDLRAWLTSQARGGGEHPLGQVLPGQQNLYARAFQAPLARGDRVSVLVKRGHLG
jgi:hypothetical protein